MCTVLLPPADNPIAVNKYIISYHIIFICQYKAKKNESFGEYFEENVYVPKCAEAVDG
jgi:hypothetical protein